jgi:hypothetical protein
MRRGDGQLDKLGLDEVDVALELDLDEGRNRRPSVAIRGEAAMPLALNE